MIWPVTRTLIISPAAQYSRGATVSLLSGTLLNDAYPLTNLVDGDGATVCRQQYGTMQVRVDLGATRTPNFVGLFNHNADDSLVVGVTNEAGLNRGFSLRDPNGWIDLRGFSTTARYWDFALSGNSVALWLGEIVIGLGSLFTGIIEPGFSEQTQYWRRVQYTEEGRQFVSATGSMTRRLPLQLQLSLTDRTALEAIFDDAGLHGGRVIVVPDSRRNECYFCEWPGQSDIAFPESDLVTTTTLDLLEQSFGVGRSPYV